LLPRPLLPRPVALPRLVALLGIAVLPACATIVSSPSQDVAVLTEPPGAACTLARNGAPVGAVLATPGTVRIGRSARETTVACTRDGHQPAQAALPPGFNPWFLGNILLGGIVGIVVDVSTGAVNRYPDEVRLALAANPAPPPPPPAVTTMDPIPDPEPVRPRRARRGGAGA